jgi:hypothetical protein
MGAPALKAEDPVKKISVVLVTVLPAPVAPPVIKKFPSGRRVVVWLCLPVSKTARACDSGQSASATAISMALLWFIRIRDIVDFPCYKFIKSVLQP